MLSRIHRLGLEQSGKKTQNQTQPYGYKPLESQHSIRLLHITRTETVNGAGRRWRYSLVTIKIQDAPKYETLSYVWGNPGRNGLLGLADGTSLRLTKALEQAMPHITEHCSTGYLWIDQICINQDDLSERAQQVSIMDSIYSRCACVLVWLGQIHSLKTEVLEQCSQVDLLFSMLLGCADLDCGDFEIQRQDIECQRLLDRFLGELVSCKLGQRDLLAMCHEIIGTSWFSRAWVFQEIVLPRRSAFILQGSWRNRQRSKTVSLPTLYELCKTAWRFWNPVTVRMSLQKREDLDTTSRYGVLKEMYHRWAERHTSTNTTSMPLVQVLSSLSAGAKTSTAHDQIYAFFGLNQDKRICINPSYEASLQDALVATARSIIEGTKSLDIFETLPRKTASKTTPSWVPDFTSPPLTIPFLPSSACMGSANTRGEASPWNGKCDGYSLGVHGKVVAVVHVSIDHQIATSKEDTNRAYIPVLLKVMQTWADSRHYDPKVPLPVLESILAALLAEGHYEPSPYVPEVTAKFANRVRNQYRDFSMRPLQQTAGDNYDRTRIHYRDTEKRTLAEYIGTVMKGRQLWITQSGRLATGSRLRSGDLLCVLHGCSHPVALRRVPKKNTYTVVSTCYLEDWMDPWGRGKVDWKEDEAEEFVLV